MSESVSNENPAKWITRATIAFAALTLIITVIFFAWWVMKEPVMFGSEKFDQVKWMQHAATIQTECKRGDMAYDLKKRILARGVSKQDVMILLGRPSLEDSNAIEYDLGKCMHVYHALRIYFDENSRLINSQISSH
jgi:hypothetical protein